MRTFNDIAAKIFSIKSEQIRDTFTAKDIPGWDSMNYLLFIAELEKEYNVSFTIDEVLNAVSLGSIRAMLVAKGAKI